jgi:cell fate (sporulation/competence/biofilm development) regulator YlbF (YheA/YmcA/DUF963 family)
MRHMSYPLYSPDLASGDFYLFATVKEKLEWVRMTGEDRFFECMQEIVRSIDENELNRVFQAWMWQVQEVSQGNGHYVRW